MKLKNFLMDSTALLLRGSVVVAFLLLFIQIGKVNRNANLIGKFSIYFICSQLVQANVWLQQRAQD